MKKLALAAGSLFIVLTGCVPNMDEKDEVVQKEDEEQKDPSVLTSYQLSDENYRTILPYRANKARGVIVDQVYNRVDINEMEEGLRRLSKSHFDPEKYYFEEGQHLADSEEDMKAFIENRLTPKKPDKVDKDMSLDEKMTYHEEHPRYVSHVLEQDFLKKNEEESTVETIGVSIGIALKSVYHFSEEGRSDHKELDHDKAIKAGKDAAQAVMERLRGKEETKDVPIMIALYEQADRASAVPGSYQMISYAEPPGRMPGDWEKLDEESVLFPSKEAKDQHFDDYKMMETFGEGVTDFFPNYVGYTGDGFYIDGNLKQLSIEIPMQFYGQGEVMAFTQYVYGLVKETFSSKYQIEVEITSSDRTESVIYRAAGEEELHVHVNG